MNVGERKKLSSEHSHRREDFCKYIALNELLFGQSFVNYQNICSTLDIELGISYERCYICLTGIKKKQYNERLGKNREDYTEFYEALQTDVEEFCREQGYLCAHTPLQYDQSKRVCFILSPLPQAICSGAQLAEHINSAAQALYQRTWLHKGDKISNFTTLSPLLTSVESIAPAFAKLQQMSDLSFFYMNPIVMTEERFNELKTPFTLTKAFALLEEIDELMRQGETLLTKEKLDILFLQHLKYSFDFQLCGDVMSKIKRKLLRYSEIFDLNLNAEVQNKFSKDAYVTIEELTEKIWAIILICMAAILKNGRSMSYLSLETINFIKVNYEHNIGLVEAAANVYVSQSYLSRVFNKEVGMSIPSYLTSLRMKRGALLLENSELKVSEVGCKVGIDNSQYFNTLFKKHMGMTPQEYRKEKRKKRML